MKDYLNLVLQIYQPVLRPAWPDVTEDEISFLIIQVQKIVVVLPFVNCNIPWVHSSVQAGPILLYHLTQRSLPVYSVLALAVPSTYHLYQLPDVKELTVIMHNQMCTHIM